MRFFFFLARSVKIGNFFVYALSFCIFPIFLCAAEDLSDLRTMARGFSSVARSTMPSVISIETRSSEDHKSMDRQDIFPNDRDSLDSFSDDFFQRFFGINPKEYSQRDFKRRNLPRVRGSGCVVSEDGYILTNSHVVKDAENIVVVFGDGSESKAKLVGIDHGTDIAVIKVDAANLSHLKFGDSDKLEVGEWVIAIGNPLGLQASVTVGIVSAKGRNNLHITDFGDLIQTDAAINPGNSGGPLLDLDGNVVGLNTAIVTTSGGYMGIGFAIPSNIVKHVMRQLVETGGVVRGFLGVAPQDLDKELADSFDLERAEGVLIADIVENSPAHEAGIHRGDIVLRVNGVSVNSVVELSREVGLMIPGEEANLGIYRKGKIIEIKVEIGVHPKSRFRLGGAAEKLGMEVEIIERENLDPSYSQEKGVSVSYVVDPEKAKLLSQLKRYLLFLKPVFVSNK